MTLPSNIADREHRKFVDDAEGNVSIRIGPDAIQDSAGNKLALNKSGQASTTDQKVMSELKGISSLLNEIKIQLQMINS